MERFLSTWFVSSVALALAALLLGTRMTIGESGDPVLTRVLALAVVGLVFTIVHEVIGGILKTISLPFIILTLGLLLVVINALLLLLTEAITTSFGVEFAIAGFGWAILAAVVISICQSLLSVFFR